MTDSVPVTGRSHGESTTGAAKAGFANAVGAYGERLAARYLVESGLQILDRNWCCDQGEIDIVALAQTRDQTRAQARAQATDQTRAQATDQVDQVEQPDQSDLSCLVIVEVKTRRTLAYGSPVEAVTAAKAARLRRLAACWMTEHRHLLDSVADVRIDVIGVLRPLQGPAQIEHLVGVAA